MKHLRLVILFLAISITGVMAQGVDTVAVWSASMKKNIKNVVITPANYAREKNAQYPVVYLLHGAYGAYSNWIKKAPFLTELSSRYGIIIICPDGDQFSWYWDSPVDSTYRYETYMTKELLPFVDKTYKTIQNRTGRAIAGLSMGGQGSLYLSWRHLDLYGACASMSGGINIECFPANWNMEKRLGSYAENHERWAEFNVSNMIYLLKPDSIKMLIDCGTEDMFYRVNCALHEKLLLSRIPHDFITRPGNHNWDYWTNSIKYQLLFFNEYFTAEKAKAEKVAQKK
ncbi:MAG: alpha/beta hydrolase family protein [Flavobacteriales bacterium]|nr:alpha/beta hydrolase family protein [Flavobacteriales bacterium]